MKRNVFLGCIVFLFAGHIFAANPNCRAPNHSSAVEDIARQYPDAFRRSCQKKGGTWEFMDRVVEKLRSLSTNWGYLCKRGNCRDLSHDVVVYYCGGGTPNSQSTNVAGFDIIANNCEDPNRPRKRTAWQSNAQKTVDAGAVSRWKYPRPGAGDWGDGNNDDDDNNNDDDGTTTTTGCRPDQREPAWKEVDGVCKPSCAGARRAYCKTNDCSGMGVNGGQLCGTDRKVVDLDSWHSPCCMIRDTNSRGVCQFRQVMPHWKAVGNECLPSCGGAKRIFCKMRNGNCEGLRVGHGRKCTDRIPSGYSKITDIPSYQTPCCILGEQGQEGEEGQE